MHEVAERIEELRELLGVKNQLSFCKELGFSQSTYAGIIGKRGSKPSLELLISIEKAFPGVNWKWVLTGEGESLAQPAAPEVATNEDLDARLENQQDLINFQRAEIAELKRQVHELESVRLTEDRGMPLGRRAHKAAEQKD